MRNYVLAILLTLFTGSALGTTFVPVSIKKQIKESDGILQGEVISIVSEEDTEGKLVTKVTLMANKWIGLKPEENFIEVFYPGGKIGDKTTVVHGSPQFEIGENVVLFTRHAQEKIWVQNLGLGKFSLKRVGGKQIIINQIFPSRPEVGQMGLNKFYDLSEWVKKKKFKERFKDKYELNQEKQAKYVARKKNSRSIASVGENETPTKKSVSGIWLVLILGGLVLMVNVLKNRSS